MILKIFIITGLVALSSICSAQIQVIPKVTSNALRTHFAIPFYVSDENQAAEINKIQFMNNIADCKSILDPFIKGIFLIKCNTSGTIGMEIQILKNNKNVTVYYDGLQILELSEIGSVVSDPNESGNSEIINAGRTLFNSNCTDCHGASVLSGRSPSSMSYAIENIPAMKNRPALKNLSESDLQKISTYLKNLGN